MHLVKVTALLLALMVVSKGNNAAEAASDQILLDVVRPPLKEETESPQKALTLLVRNWPEGERTPEEKIINPWRQRITPNKEANLAPIKADYKEPSLNLHKNLHEGIEQYCRQGKYDNVHIFVNASSILQKNLDIKDLNLDLDLFSNNKMNAINEKMKLLDDVIYKISSYVKSEFYLNLDIELFPYFTLSSPSHYVIRSAALIKQHPFHLLISPLFMETLKELFPEIGEEENLKSSHNEDILSPRTKAVLSPGLNRTGSYSGSSPKDKPSLPRKGSLFDRVFGKSVSPREAVSPRAGASPPGSPLVSPRETARETVSPRSIASPPRQEEGSPVVSPRDPLSVSPGASAGSFFSTHAKGTEESIPRSSSTPDNSSSNLARKASFMDRFKKGAHAKTGSLDKISLRPPAKPSPSPQAPISPRPIPPASSPPTSPPISPLASPRAPLSPLRARPYWQNILIEKFPDDRRERDNEIIAEIIESSSRLQKALTDMREFLQASEMTFKLTMSKEAKNYADNPEKFYSEFPQTLSYLVAQEFYLQDPARQASIRKFLTEKGLKEIKIGRRDNEYTNRKNVWMVSAVKSLPINK